MSDLTSLPLFRHTPVDDPSDLLLPAPPPLSTPLGVQLPPVAVAQRNSSTHTNGRAQAADPVDWALVRRERMKAAELLSSRVKHRDGLSEAEHREHGRAVISEVLREHNNQRVDNGEPPLTAAAERATASAFFDVLFGLGRLQQLLNLPGVTDIQIRGFDNVHVTYLDGRQEKAAAIADSNEDLMEFIAMLASREGRPWSRLHSKLNLALPGRVRLAASAWTTPYPCLTLRLMPLGNVDLPKLVELGGMSPVLADFLAAAVRADKSIIVTGIQGTGKTSLLQAMASVLPADEAVGTVETEFELYLHDMGGRHTNVIPEQERPGMGERDADGRVMGEVTLEDLLYQAHRHSLRRIFVGELRGPREFRALLDAMKTSAGSLSTVHGKTPREALERLGGIGSRAGMETDEAYAQLATSIDLIVQMRKEKVGGRLVRYVHEVAEVTSGEGGRPALNRCFVPDASGTVAVPNTPPTFLAELEEAGFDRSQLFTEHENRFTS